MERQLNLLKAVEMGFDAVETLYLHPHKYGLWPSGSFGLEKFNARDDLNDDY